MPDNEAIAQSVDCIADVMQDAAVRNGDMLEAESERLEIPIADLMDRVANELRARFDY